MSAAAAHLVGSVDCAALANRRAGEPPPAEWSPELTRRLVRSIELVDEGQGRLRVDFHLQSALYKMVRNMVGLLLLVGWNRRLIYTITAFTFGHSVTLAMVTLGLFDYPVSLVEFMIALSIYVLAVELARGSAGALWRQPWWLAGGFGLLHGMGFAGALADTGLPQSNVPLALLFFNVGIELGQLAFIAPLVLLAAIGGGLMGERVGVLRPLPVYVLGGLSAMWCIERGLEVLA